MYERTQASNETKSIDLKTKKKMSRLLSFIFFFILSNLTCFAFQLPIRHSIFGWEDSISISNLRAPNKILKLLRLHRGSLLVLQSDNNRIIMYSVLVPTQAGKESQNETSKKNNLYSDSDGKGCLLVDERKVKDEQDNDIRLKYDLLSTVSVDGDKSKAICIAMMRVWIFYSIGKDIQTSSIMSSKEFMSWIESESHMSSSF